MKHATSLAGGLAGLALLSSAPAFAVTDGEPDAGRHPYVGLMVAKDADGTPLWRCTGTLIAPQLFLTAGHCTEAPASTIEVWFQEDLTNAAAVNYPTTGQVQGTPYTHPLYNPNAFFLYDLGMVVLDEPVTMSEYGALPELNVLDQYAKRRGQNKLTFTAVGYGLQQSFPDAASWKENNLRLRLVSYPRLIQINVPGYVGDFSLLLSNNANTGGTCFGDSGGPNFIGDTNVIAGVTSFGKNGTCAGTGGVYRIDRADDLDWIYGTFGQYLQ
jgi:secreted trypsin-like serine protease